MTHKSNAAGRSHKWATRRVMGSVLGVAVVVGTAATAQASAHGDGFFTPHKSSQTTARTTATAAMGGYRQQVMDEPAKRQPARTTDEHGSTHDDHGMTQCSAGHRKAAVRYDDMKQARRDATWSWAGGGSSRYEFRTLGDKADRTFNQLLGVNDCGNIVGYYGSGADAAHPNKGFSVNAPYNRHAFMDENYPRSAQTQVVGENNDGTTVGFYVDHDGNNYGFVHRDGKWDRVEFPGTTSRPSFNQLLGVNEHGIAAGFWNDDRGNSHGYLYNTWNEHFTAIELPVHADSVTVTGVNDRGQAVGFYKDGKNTHGFISSDHSFKTLRLGDDSNTQVLGINEDGDVVGSYVGHHGTTHGFVRMDDKIRVIDAPGSTSTVVNGLNNRGQIVGFYQDHDMNTKGFTAHQ